VHMVIVDPGVGTARRPVILTGDRHLFVAPDNGVLSLIYDREERLSVRHVTAEHYFLQPRSNTFHARDIFSPVAANLAKGVAADRFGEEITDYVRFGAPRPKPVDERTLRGVVLKVDRFGNLNTTWGSRNGQQVRLPGSGGACDIASLSQRTVVLLEHNCQRLVSRVGHITSPGNGTGNGWRREQGLPLRSGPSAIITTMGVLRFGDDGEAYLASVHPGVTVEDVLSNTGWTLRVADDLATTPEPDPAELAAIREIDPQHFWTKL